MITTADSMQNLNKSFVGQIINNPLPNLHSMAGTLLFRTYFSQFCGCPLNSLRASSPIWANEASCARVSEQGVRKGEFAMICCKFSFVLRPDEKKYHWLKSDVPEVKVDSLQAYLACRKFSQQM